MTYTYNLAGALIEQTYPSGRVVKNSFDSDGDLQQVQSRRANDSFRNYANAFTYTAAGAFSSMRLGNGRWENTAFNSRLQPTQIGLGSSATNQNLLKLNYDYGTTDNNGNVKSQTITVPGLAQPFIQNYTYDELNRLKSATETNNGSQTWTQVYSFDRYGNRNITSGLGQTSFSFSGNRITAHSYDLAGNTTADATGKTFTYDAENKQRTAVVTGYTNEYFYDGDGRRVRKVVPSTGETTVFVYDALGKLVAEYSTIVAPTNDAKVAYLTNDHLGSPRINTDATGTITARQDYRPFGEEIIRNGNGYTTDTVRKQFTGYERDVETDLDFAQARFFASALGRFSTPDPYGGSGYVSVPQSWNRYVYCLNRPLVFVDPNGLIWLTNDGGQNFIWVDDKYYKKNKDQYEGYVGANKTVIKLGSVTGFDGKYDNLVGSSVILNANGTITPTEDARAEDATVEVRAEYDELDVDNPWSGLPGALRTPTSGPPNSYDKYRGGPGKYTLRFFDGKGNARLDIDFGHDHGAGDPHAHWWDWNSESPRGPGVPIPAGTTDSVDADGDRIIKPSEDMINEFELYPVPMRIPGRAPVPVRPTVPIRIPIRVPVPVPIIP